MAGFFESDAVPTGFFVGEFSRSLKDFIHTIENSLEWYDHIACAFLLYDNPNEAFQKILSLRTNYLSKNSSNWRQIVFRTLLKSGQNDESDISRKLEDALFVIKNYRLISLLEIPVKHTCSIDPERLKLFYKIDSMSENEAKLWIEKVTSQIGGPEADPSWCVEMHCLKWIEAGFKIPDEALSLQFSSTITPVNIPSEDLQYPSTVPPVKKRIESSSDNEKDMEIEITNGLCIIINQMDFYTVGEPLNTNEELGYRYGSDVDRDHLRESFHMLGHDVEVYENLDRKTLLHELGNISRKDFKRYDGLVMCILSHGSQGEIFTVDSFPVSINTIKSYFDGTHCPGLVKKPKLFFLQVCQGLETQKQVSLDEVQNDGPVVTPAVSDFFEAWATVPGFLSYRSTLHGSVFVRELCSILQTYAHKKGLSDLMTLVNNRVSKSNIPGNRVQMPCNTSCLTQSVYFKRNHDKFVEAIVDQFERELLDKIVRSATLTLLQTDLATVQKTVDTWRT